MTSLYSEEHQFDWNYWLDSRADALSVAVP